jgi:hypothetical protein
MPLTYFEKWSFVINGLDKDFFFRKSADIAVFNKILDDGREKDYKLLERKYGKKMQYVDPFAKLIVDMSDKMRKKEATTPIDLERLKDLKDKKYREEIMDYLYTIRVGAFINDEGIVEFDLSDYGSENKTHTEMMLGALLKNFYRFNKYGRKQFRVDEQLMDELLLTGVQGVDAMFFKIALSSI